MFVSTVKLPDESDFTNPADDKPSCVRADEVEVVVSRVPAEAGIVVPFTEVTFGKDVVAEVISVVLDGITVPLIEVAVATPNEGVVKLGLTSVAYEASVPLVLSVGLGK